jgi:hypothetical protein
MWAEDIALGVAGLRFEPGDHICAFYPGVTERDDLLIPYLREGLKAGDKCICVVDGSPSESIFAELGATVDLDSCLRQRQLEVARSQDTYLCGDRFSISAMLDFWDRVIGEAVTDGFPFVRSVGEMTWALRRLPGVEELVRYEAKLNEFLPRYPQVILCLYELHRFSGDVLVDVLKTHPKVLLGGMLLRNPYYLEPDEFLAGRP